MSVATPAPKPPPASMSPRTIAMNRIPPELDRRLTACDAFVELRMKNDMLKHFRFFKTDQPPDIPHDPSFHLMADNGSIVAPMVGVLSISGYGRTASSGSARELELGMHLPVVPTEENLREMAQHITEQQRYFEMRRRADEELLDYANIGFDTADSARLHIGHFINTVDDADLARPLATLRLVHEGDLRAVLRDLLRQNQRVKRDDARRSRPGKKDFPRRKSVQPVARKRVAWVTVKAAEPAEADSSSDEDGVDSESDYDLCSIDSEADLSSSDGEEADQQTLKAVGGVERPTAQMLAKIFAAMRSDKATRTMPGGGGGQDRPCQLEKLANHLKDWFDPTKRAGRLPTQVEELLN
ncbi:hypothetical protein P43SY_004967 [Pythium insidiosum]|uniref:Uncharacterized protein n=1 Tax=Pythium insidiosum TaxID=114742 RepID=A0AAD5LV42_PYTIN|nr:hypothetical protein P43SY_004967 [Pythium insidiosum]